MIRIDRRIAWVVGVIVAVLAVWVASGIVGSAFGPRVTGTSAELDGQRAATERALQRIYAAAVDQLKTTRGLKLAIPDAQAAAIEQKYDDQLKQLRVTALQAIADAYGQNADQAAQYAAAAAPRLDAAGPTPAGPATLLAPRLYSIVDRMQQLASQVADAGVREMTQPTPGGSPTPATPTPTPRGTPGPSPSR